MLDGGTRAILVMPDVYRCAATRTAFFVARNVKILQGVCMRHLAIVFFVLIGCAVAANALPECDPEKVTAMLEGTKADEILVNDQPNFHTINYTELLCHIDKIEKDMTNLWKPSPMLPRPLYLISINRNSELD